MARKHKTETAPAIDPPVAEQPIAEQPVEPDPVEPDEPDPQMEPPKATEPSAKMVVLVNRATEKHPTRMADGITFQLGRARVPLTTAQEMVRKNPRLYRIE